MSKVPGMLLVVGPSLSPSDEGNPNTTPPVSSTSVSPWSITGSSMLKGNDSTRVDEQPEQPTRLIQEIVAAGWQNRDRADNVRCLVRRIQRLDQEMSGAARDRFAAFVPEGT